jgi:hypothetical protein
MVAQIAQNHLTNRSRRNVARLLGNASLASVANFADTVLHSNPPSTRRPETRKWHFVDIPVENPDNTYDPSRDCIPSPDGDCAIAEIDRAKNTLTDPGATRAQRVEALKFIVHFVGDLHQPLHSAERNNDAGANLVRVTFIGAQSNLHRVWDSGMILRAMQQPNRSNEGRYVRLLERGITSGTISASDGGTDVDWANEAHKAATMNAYGKLPGANPDGSFTLGQSYFTDNLVVVDQQMARAGLRLAKILNEAFDR